MDAVFNSELILHHCEHTASKSSYSIRVSSILHYARYRMHLYGLHPLYKLLSQANVTLTNVAYSDAVSPWYMVSSSTKTRRDPRNQKAHAVQNFLFM